MYISCVSLFPRPPFPGRSSLDPAHFVHGLPESLVHRMEGLLISFIVAEVRDHVDHGGNRIHVGTLQEPRRELDGYRRRSRIAVRIGIPEQAVLAVTELALVGEIHDGEGPGPPPIHEYAAVLGKAHRIALDDYGRAGIVEHAPAGERDEFAVGVLAQAVSARVAGTLFPFHSEESGIG